MSGTSGTQNLQLADSRSNSGEELALRSAEITAFFGWLPTRMARLVEVLVLVSVEITESCTNMRRLAGSQQRMQNKTRHIARFCVALLRSPLLHAVIPCRSDES
jgi:hypothetical protein